MKKDILELARDELLTPLDLETARLRAAIMEATAKIRAVLDAK